MKYIIYIALGLASLFVILYLSSNIKIQRGILYPETEGKKIIEDYYNKKGEALPKFISKEAENNFIVKQLTSL